jgi:hypothetical protein
MRKHPLTAFFVLAYLLTWWIYPLLTFSPLLGLFGLFGPALAAIIMAGVAEGKSGVKALLRRAVLWRVGLPWYVIALGLPTILSLATAALAYLVGMAEFIRAGALTSIELVLFVLAAAAGEAIRPDGELDLGCALGTMAPADVPRAWHAAVRVAVDGVRAADYRVLDLDDLGLSPYARQRSYRDVVPRRHQPFAGPFPRRR